MREDGLFCNDECVHCKMRSIMNLCTNSRLSTTFLSSLEDSIEPNTTDYIFKNVDKCIEDIGLEKVIQVMKDYCSNKRRRPT